MKTLKLSALLLLSILIVSATGCVTVTGELNPEKSTFLSDQAVTQDHPLYKKIHVESVSNYPGTSPITLAFNLNPNLNEDTAREVLENSLNSANFLSPDINSEYGISAELLNPSLSEFRGETSINGMHRVYETRYILTSSGKELYNKVVVGEGDSDGGGMAFYLVEREAAEKATQDSLRKLIDDLKSLQID